MDVVRVGLKSMVSAFFVWQIQSVLLLMVIYMASIIYFLSELGMWDVEQTKNTVIWCVSVGVMSLFKLKSFQKDSGFFKRSVLANLKLIAIFELVVSAYSFPLLIEILLLPLLTFISVLIAFAELDARHYIVKRVLEAVLSIFGLVVICYTVYMLFIDLRGVANEQTVYDFLVPPLLTLLYLPFIFFMVIYTSYQYSSVRLRFLIKDQKLRYLAVFYSLVVFNFRVRLLDRWAASLPFLNTDTHAGIIESFKHILKVVKLEKLPPTIHINEGWSPYEAKDFLVDVGIVTGNYNKQYGEWSASSSMITIGDGMLPDNIAYYVDGTEEAANQLKIKLNVNNEENRNESHGRLLEASKLLFSTAINENLPATFIAGILNGVSTKGEVGNFLISLDKDLWHNKSLSGYNMKFVISLP